MPATFYYMRDDELFTPDAGVAGSVAADYTAGWLCDRRPGRPVRGPIGGSLSLTVTNPAKTCDAAVIANSNLSVAAVLGGDITLSLTPVTPENGIPLNKWGTFSPVSVDTVTLTVTTNPVDAIIGELYVGKIRSLARNLQRSQNVWQFETYAIRPGAEFGSVQPYDKGLEGRRLNGANLYSPTEFDDMLAWFRSCRDGSRPTIIMPDGDVDDAWIVNFTAFEWRRAPMSSGEIWYEVGMAFEELPRSRW